MKRQRAPLEIFTIAFLDIISCAFGAIVLSVLLSKTQVTPVFSQTDAYQNQQSILLQKQQQLQTLLQENTQREQRIQQQKGAITKINDDLRILTKSADSLQEIVESRQRATTQQGTELERDPAVGGIPVDSEYIIFIIDTSGSMQRIWQKVLETMGNILDIHPRVKGVQIMSDMGDYLVSASTGKWRKDTPNSRKAILAALRRWRTRSNSSPVEGLAIALKTYAKKTERLSIYILGDEYTGQTYDPVIDTLKQLNTDPITGKRLARVHAIGFRSGQSTIKFSTLMREVAGQNRGTFLALP